MRDWPIVKAEEFCFKVTDGTHDSPKAQSSGRKLITSKHLKGHFIDFDSANLISEEDYVKIISRSAVEQWDILYSMIGTIGNIYIEKSPNVEYACKNMGIFKFGGKRNDSLWMYYYLKSPQANAYIQANLRGSTQAYVPLGALRNLPITLPPMEDRIKIISILRSIDERIEANHAINDNLLQQVIALFNNAYESATSEAPFTSIVQVLSGGTPKTDNETFWNGAIPFFTPKDVGTPYTLTTEKYITGEGLAHCNSRLYPTNTTFVTARGTVGKVSLAGCPMAMNQSCYALGGIRIHPLLVYCYTLQVIDALKHKATGAVFDAITVRDFNAESIKRIDCECESQLLSMIEPMFSSILTNSMENQRLMTLRNTLLPKIMSGEIDVSAVSLGS